jgi:hypothetical protein
MAPLTGDSFWAEYEDFAARLLRPLEPRDALPESEIAQAEGRLGLRLPRVLREYYLRAGAFDEINKAHNDLLRPSELFTASGALVFYEESHAAAWWGVRLDQITADDPPVYEAIPPEPVEWYFEQERLSGFLKTMFFVQLALGGGACSEVLDVTEDGIVAIRERWPRVELNLGRARDDLQVYSSGGQALCVLRGEEGLQLIAVARTEKEFRPIVEALGLRRVQTRSRRERR